MTTTQAGTARVLVVEDERLLARAVARGLNANGFSVALAHDGHDGYLLAKQEKFDVIVLDLMLPGLPGTEVCRRLRTEGVRAPILVLTAREGLEDEAEALDLGADDYLRKPFSYLVLVARLNALLRRGLVEGPAPVVVGDLVLDPRRRTVRRGQVRIELTRREFAVLEQLMLSAGQPLAKQEILDRVWGPAVDRDPNVVEVYVGYLRRKIDEPFGVTTLHTVRGVGYQVGEP